MEIKLEDLLTSKIFVKETSNINFKSPRQYLEPFMEQLQPVSSNMRVMVSSPVMNKEESGIVNVAYPRINIEATMGSDLIPGFNSVIGLIYALDTQIPIMKVYTGQSVRACLNLTIFNAEDMFEQNLLSTSQEVYGKIKTFKDNKQKQIDEYGKIYKSLTDRQLTKEEMNELLGRLLIHGASGKLGTSPVASAARLLTDNKSVYYTERSGEFNCTPWNVYNAVTQALTDSADPIYKPNKTLELAKVVMSN